MAKKVRTGRTLALIIILGAFIAAMVISLSNLTVDYAYERPVYEKFCNTASYLNGPYGTQAIKAQARTGCICNYSQQIQDQETSCISSQGTPVYDYYETGCVKSVKSCDMCQKNLDDATKKYNHNVFFIFAIIGFLMIAVGLFLESLLLQIILLPAGAWLVIQGSVGNFDEKLSVIICFALLIIAAVYLAMKKLGKR